MRALLVACLLVCVASGVAPGAQAAMLPLADVTRALLLDARGEPHALFALGMSPSGLDAGEERLFDEQLDEPLALLELADLPPELLGLLTVDELGPVQGPRVTELPRDTALAAAALAEDPVRAEDLRSYRLRAEVRNAPGGEPGEDMAAMLAGAYG